MGSAVRRPHPAEVTPKASCGHGPSVKSRPCTCESLQTDKVWNGQEVPSRPPGHKGSAQRRGGWGWQGCWGPRLSGLVLFQGPPSGALLGSRADGASALGLKSAAGDLGVGYLHFRHGGGGSTWGHRGLMSGGPHLHGGERSQTGGAGWLRHPCIPQGTLRHAWLVTRRAEAGTLGGAARGQAGCVPPQSPS